MNLESTLSTALSDILKEMFGSSLSDDLIQLQKTRKDFEGDITLVIFPFLKLSGKGPEETGAQIGDKIVEAIDIVSGYNTVKGFLNLEISNSYWLQTLGSISKTENYGINSANDSLIMVEYSSPNTNKPLHLGHLRNNFLGHSVSRILGANGNESVKTQIINDRGIHICKSMLAWQRFGEGVTPESAGIKGDKLVGKFYVEFDKKLKEEAAVLGEAWMKSEFGAAPDEVIAEYKKLTAAAAEKEDDKARKGIEGKIKELINNHTQIMKDVKEMLLKWEAKDTEVYELWTKMNSWVYAGFDVTYQTMGVDFDKLYYESKTFITGKELVEKGLTDGVFFKRDEIGRAHV